MARRSSCPRRRRPRRGCRSCSRRRGSPGRCRLFRDALQGRLLLSSASCRCRCWPRRQQRSCHAELSFVSTAAFWSTCSLVDSSSAGAKVSLVYAREEEAAAGEREREREMHRNTGRRSCERLKRDFGLPPLAGSRSQKFATPTCERRGKVSVSPRAFYPCQSLLVSADLAPALPRLASRR